MCLLTDQPGFNSHVELLFCRCEPAVGTTRTVKNGAVSSQKRRCEAGVRSLPPEKGGVSHTSRQLAPRYGMRVQICGYMYPSAEDRQGRIQHTTHLVVCEQTTPGPPGPPAVPCWQEDCNRKQECQSYSRLWAPVTRALISRAWHS